MARPRREAEIEQTRGFILDAAARVLAHKGYKGATMQDIAAEAEYTAPTLYSYFKGKEAILEALLRRLFEELNAVLDEAPPHELSLPGRLEWMQRRQLELVQRRRDSVLALQAMPPERFEALCPEALPGQFVGHIAAWLERNAAPGELAHDPETTAWLLWGLGHGVFMRWLVAGAGEDLPEGAALLRAVFEGGFLGG